MIIVLAFVKVLVGAFIQEKVLVGGFSVKTLFAALASTDYKENGNETNCMHSTLLTALVYLQPLAKIQAWLVMVNCWG